MLDGCAVFVSRGFVSRGLSPAAAPAVSARLFRASLSPPARFAAAHPQKPADGRGDDRGAGRRKAGGRQQRRPFRLTVRSFFHCAGLAAMLQPDFQAALTA